MHSAIVGQRLAMGRGHQQAAPLFFSRRRRAEFAAVAAVGDGRRGRCCACQAVSPFAFGGGATFRGGAVALCLCRRRLARCAGGEGGGHAIYHRRLGLLADKRMAKCCRRRAASPPLFAPFLFWRRRFKILNLKFISLRNNICQKQKAQKKKTPAKTRRGNKV